MTHPEPRRRQLRPRRPGSYRIPSLGVGMACLPVLSRRYREMALCQWKVFVRAGNRIQRLGDCRMAVAWLQFPSTGACRLKAVAHPLMRHVLRSGARRQQIPRCHRRRNTMMKIRHRERNWKNCCLSMKSKSCFRHPGCCRSSRPNPSRRGSNYLLRNCRGNSYGRRDCPANNFRPRARSCHRRRHEILLLRRVLHRGRSQCGLATMSAPAVTTATNNLARDRTA